MYRYMMAACGPDPNETKIARYCEESLGTSTGWWPGASLSIRRSAPITSMAPDGTEGLVYSGGEDAYPFNAIARPAPRGHLAKTKRSTGWLLMQHLAAAATGAGAAVSNDTRVDRLICADGRVVGVQAQRFGETVTFAGPARRRAHSGRLHLNDDMLRQHCPPLARGTFKVGTEGDDGGASAWPRPSGRACATCTPARCRCPSRRHGH